MSLNRLLDHTGVYAQELDDGTIHLDFTDNGEVRKFNSELVSRAKNVTTMPIHSSQYKGINYFMYDQENISISGEIECDKRINSIVLFSLSCFPSIGFQEVYVYDPIQRKNVKKTQYIPNSKIDTIKSITIKGNIKYLDHCINESSFYDESKVPFNRIQLPNVKDEDPIPFRFMNLETIDLQDCYELKYVEFRFFMNPTLKTLILPQHKITASSLPEEYLGRKVEVINKEYVEIGTLNEEEGCCSIQ